MVEMNLKEVRHHYEKMSSNPALIRSCYRNSSHIRGHTRTIVTETAPPRREGVHEQVTSSFSGKMPPHRYGPQLPTPLYPSLDKPVPAYLYHLYPSFDEPVHEPVPVHLPMSIGRL